MLLDCPHDAWWEANWCLVGEQVALYSIPEHIALEQYMNMSCALYHVLFPSSSRVIILPLALIHVYMCVALIIDVMGLNLCFLTYFLFSSFLYFDQPYLNMFPKQSYVWWGLGLQTLYKHVKVRLNYAYMLSKPSIRGRFYMYLFSISNMVVL